MSPADVLIKAGFMRYIALLRGINVGNEKRIEMRRLRSLFASLGFANVSTYINSGNVIFEGKGKQKDIRKMIESNLKKEFDFDIPCLIKTAREIGRIAEAIPKKWRNDSLQRTDVAFLFPNIDSRKIVDGLPLNKDYIDVRYAKGAVYWNMDRKNYGKSRLNKIIGHEFYQFMTLRNLNTVRYLAGLK